MADNELLIKINADAKNATAAFEDVQKKTEDLDSQLSNIAKVSAVAFAAFTAEIGFSIKAFGDAEKAGNSLTASLQQQGIFTVALRDQYRSYAEAVQDATGIDDDAVIQAQALLQNYIGQTKITKELTFAVVDFAAAKRIDLNSAAELVGRTIGTETNALVRSGIQIDETASKTEKLTLVTNALAGQFGGQAAVANQGIGSLKGLETAFQNLQEAIGARFAPLFADVVKSITSFFTAIGKNDDLVDFGVALTVAGASIAALGIVIPGVIAGIGLFRAALAAAEISITGTRLALSALIGATGIGLLVVAATELYLNWSTIFPRIQAVAHAFAQNIADVFGGLGKILQGAFVLSPDLISEGLDQIRSAFNAGVTSYHADVKKSEDTIAALKKASEEKQIVSAKVGADAREKISADEAAIRKQLLSAQIELSRMEAANESADLIAIKKAEIQILSELEKTKNASLKAVLLARFKDEKDLEQQAIQEEVQQNIAFAQVQVQAQEELYGTLTQQDLTYQAAKLAALRDTILTEQGANDKLYQDTLKSDIAQHNDRVLEQKKYGTAVAAVNAVIHSTEVVGLQKGTAELVGLQNSRFGVLKEIGKAAAIADVTIKTAQAAVNVVEGFSSIPFIGTALGVVAATAVIAYGAEQIGNIVAANEGGVVPGGGPNQDSQLSFLTPGELVTPRQNFDEVINSVKLTREMKEQGGAGGSAQVEISLKDGLMDFIELKLVERKSLGISLQGA